jgi:hypothetical protein
MTSWLTDHPPASCVIGARVRGGLAMGVVPLWRVESDP